MPTRHDVLECQQPAQWDDQQEGDGEAGQQRAKDKEGRESVECHPVVAAPAKSRPTMLWIDTTTGAMIAAMTP